MGNEAFDVRGEVVGVGALCGRLRLVLLRQMGCGEGGPGVVVGSGGMSAAQGQGGVSPLSGVGTGGLLLSL